MPNLTESAAKHVHADGEQGGDLKQRVRSQEAGIPEGSVVYPFDSRDQRAAEQYRIARTKFLHHPYSPRIMAITSPQAGDGKSVTALNLAGTLALKGNHSVLLVDADLRRSALAGLLGIPTYPGLEEVLREQCSLSEAIVHVNLTPAIYVLPAGGRASHPAELFESTRWAHACEQMRSEFDHVVIDTTPVGVVADYELVERVVDGVIVVVRPDHSDRTVCLAALQAISRDKLLGVILNCVPEQFSGTNGYRNYESYRAPHD
jgi:capsular exopolysaccharide synthesis family protein